MSKRVVCFFYGSNMSSERLKAKNRAPSAKSIEIGKIDNKKLVCNKKSIDGTGKANLIEEIGSTVWGVLFEVDETEIRILDKIEKGYERKTTEVIIDQV
ncbi:gamma-glutamylcyclotransferase family protein [candidate division KSB1 bacterium]